MTNKPLFPWLNGKLGWPCARKPMINPSSSWLKKSPSASLMHQEISRRQLRDRLAKVERRMETCPIAPVQEQMQTVWFHLVHEYLKNKRKAVNDESSHD